MAGARTFEGDSSDYSNIVDIGDSSDYCNCWSGNLDNTQNINCFASYTQDGFLCFTVFENL